VDDYSRYTWVFFLHDKADVSDIFKRFVTRAKNEFENKLKKVRSDNGSEFKNSRIENFCDEKGIKHEFSTTYTPVIAIIWMGQKWAMEQDGLRG
jgi:transposase InsO family protein